MDQMSDTPVEIPHLLQLCPQSIDPKFQSPHIIHISHPASQQNTTSGSLNMTASSQPEVEHHQIQITQNQIIMPSQAHLQHQPVQAQVASLHSPDVGSSIQITSHVILPQVPVFKHVLINGGQQYYEYEPYHKDQSVMKMEREVIIDAKRIKGKSEDEGKEDMGKPGKKRSQVANPDKWACNIRKMKHQRGEAYISRRGKFVPERRVRNTKDCIRSCKFKCNEKISDTDREHIFKAFYSLNANEKKHFLLNTTERNYINKHKISEGNLKRRYSFKYFFLVRAVRYMVCKNFYLGTLAISQKPVYNVHLGKSDMNIPKPDGRGLSESSCHTLPSEVKDRVRKHIMSFSTTDSKPIKQFARKKQYLDPSLSIKQMYNMYFDECGKENSVPVKESMYRRIFKNEFNLHFRKKNNQQVCCKCKGVIKKEQ